MFNTYKSFQQLQSLSEHLIDLTDPSVFNEKRIKTFMASNGGMHFLYGTQRVTPEVMEALKNLAQESQCIEKMHAMQKGEVLNRIEGFESENRKVLHTAMRDFFEHPNTNPAAKEAAHQAYLEIEKLKEFCQKNDKENKFTDLIQIGIGGSDLGPRAIAGALKGYYKTGRRVHFISNVDPDDAASIIDKVDLAKTLIVCISKSGTTLETLTNEYFIKEALQKKGLNLKDHIVSVTGKGSPMDDPEKYLASFYIWDYIGGRYSATSMVGGVTLSFAMGFDRFWEFLQGAHAMDLIAKDADIHRNLPLLCALIGIWNRNFLSYPTLAIIPYSEALSRFPAHLQQLDMESNGKQVDITGKQVPYKTGPIVWGEPGTNGQHSFYQLLHQGTDIVPVEFIGYGKSTLNQDVSFDRTTSQEKLLSNLLAQSIALAQGKKENNPNKSFFGNRPNSILFMERLTPKTMGMLLSFYEHKVAFQGFIWNINSFDQEGVQLGKKLASRIISLFKNEKEAFPVAATYLELLSLRK